MWWILFIVLLALFFVGIIIDSPGLITFAAAGVAVIIFIVVTSENNLEKSCDVACSPYKSKIISERCYCLQHDGSYKIKELSK